VLSQDKYNSQKDDKIQKVREELGKAKDVLLENIGACCAEICM
jgi:hypothetical protein